MQLSGVQIVIERLCAHGVNTVFGYPGGAVLPLYDELYNNVHRIHHVITAHEQGAAHAADGYSRATGKTGVVIATSGPGATNLVTGIANAYLDSVPMVAITGNVATDLLGRDSFQEVDIGGITQAIVKHNYVIRDIEKLEETIDESFRIANSGRPGPVLIDIPKNIQVAVCDYVGKTPARNELPECTFDVDHIVDLIEASKKPFIYAGGGVIASDAGAELRELSERISAPVGLSMMGLSALPNDFDANLGMSGMHGKYASIIAQSECDLMIALGVRFSDRATGKISHFTIGKTIIHVDIDLAEIGKNVPSQVSVCGDVKDFLIKLLSALSPVRREDWLKRISELRQAEQAGEEAENGNFTPKNIIKTVNQSCGDDTIIVTDVGQHQMWVVQHYKFMKARTLLTSGGLGAMGYGMGAAIGSCMAMNGKRTVLFTGDGSFGMNLIELATAVTQKLPIVVIILNNNSLGLPRQWQSMFFGERYSNSTLNRKTDFTALAKAFGADGHSAFTLSEVSEIMAGLPEDRPVVIDCHIDINEMVFPMIPPGGTVKDMVLRR